MTNLPPNNTKIRIGADLYGFDILCAITQATLKAQFGLLFTQGIIPTAWKVDTDSSSIEATLGLPSIELSAPNGASKANIKFAIRSGKFEYKKIKNNQIQSNSVDISKMILSLTVNLDIAGIARNAIANSTAIPPSVKNILSSADFQSYDISHIFMDFENADLVAAYSFTYPDGTAPPDFNDQDVIVEIDAAVRSLVASRKGTDNPYILGYAAATDATSAKDGDLVPTGSTFSVYADSKPDRNTLNVLSVTGPYAVPTGQAIQLKQNFVDSDDMEGVLVISQDSLMRLILPPFARYLSKDVTDFKRSGATLSLAGRNAQGGTTTVSIVPVPAPAKAPVSPPAKPPPPPPAKLVASFRASYTTDIKSSGSKIGASAITATWNTTLQFGVANDGLKIDVTSSTPAASHNDHLTFWGAFLKAFSAAYSNPFVIDKQWNDTFASQALAQKVQLPTDFKTTLIPPGAGKFFFKEPWFTPEGHLVLTLTVRN